MSEKIKKDKPWNWTENKWREIVSRVSAGRSLNPKIWPGNADVTVAISFDSDHETSVLRWGSDSIGQISQGEYGSRKGIPRILEVLKQFDVKATFFVPAVSALLHPEEIKTIDNENQLIDAINDFSRIRKTKRKKIEHLQEFRIEESMSKYLKLLKELTT